MDFAKLQEGQPWSIAYSEEFKKSADTNVYRRVTHDILHVLKGLGRIAAECEYIDHGKDGKLTREQFADNLADLVTCAMHIATEMDINLEDAVISNMERRNGVKINRS